MINYYKILGVQDFAHTEEIKTAYRKLSKKFHPDVNQGDKFFEERFKEIQSAYEALNNPAERKKVDDFLKQSESKNQFYSYHDQSTTQAKASNSDRQSQYKEKSYSQTENREPANENIKNQGTNSKNTINNSIVFTFIGIVVFVIVCFIVIVNTKKDNVSAYLGNSNTNHSFPSGESSSPKQSTSEPDYKKEEDRYKNLNISVGNFSIGSTKKEVLSIQGNPTSTMNLDALNQEIWSYGRSTVTFTGGKVSEYADYGKNLRVQYSDKTIIENGNLAKSNFSIGSSKKEVLSIQGNPTSTMKLDALNQEIWTYGRSTVTFTGGKVSEYADYGNNLRVQY